MAVKIAPSPRQQFEDANGVPYVGGKLFTYAAGSSTKQATYTDSVGGTANTNPIVLDSAGRTPYGLWLTAGLNYKFVLALSTDTDPPGSPIFTEDNISGTNDTTTTVSQWTASASTPTYISGTSFSLVGDKTADFHVGRRLKFTVTAGTVYGLISATAYTTLSTVTVVLDSGSLDSGLSAVELSILTSTGSSLPATSYMRTLFDDVDAATARATLGVPTAIDSWPIGSVFIGVVATNPNTLLGGGTWAAFGAGRVMVGLDASQTEFDTVEETGGAKTHTLTTAEMPSHIHTSTALATAVADGTSAYNTGTGAVQGTTNSNATGGGGAHNNLQPYIVVYFWKRTA